MTGCRRVDMPSGDVCRHPASTCSCYGSLCEDYLLRRHCCVPCSNIREVGVGGWCLFSVILLMIEPTPVSLCLYVGFYREKVDFFPVSCREVKDALEWSYHPTCTSPMSQPGRMEMGAHFHRALCLHVWPVVFLRTA